jgi:hypothetical protein
VELRSQIKFEHGLEGSNFSLRSGLFHFGEEVLSNSGGAEAVAIEMQEPGWIGGDIGGPQGSRLTG